MFGECFAGGRALEHVVGQQFEMQAELGIQLILPLLDEVAGTDDHAPLHITADDQFLDEQTGHDGLAGPRIVSQYIAQRMFGEHACIHCGNLVGKRLDCGRMHGEEGVEQVGKLDALGFGDKLESGPIRLKIRMVPMAGDDPRGGFFVGGDHAAKRAILAFVDDFCTRAIWFYGEDLHSLVGNDAFDVLFLLQIRYVHLCAPSCPNYTALRS